VLDRPTRKYGVPDARPSSSSMPPNATNHSPGSVAASQLATLPLSSSRHSCKKMASGLSAVTHAAISFHRCFVGGLNSVFSVKTRSTGMPDKSTSTA